MGTFGAPHMPLDEIGNLAGALADESNDDDVGLGAMGDHVQQHRFAHARAGHDADALAHTKGDQRIQGANSHIKTVADGCAIQRPRPHPAHRP